MGGMPDPIEDSTDRGGAPKYFKHVEDWLNDTNLATRRTRRSQARTKVGNFGTISPSNTLSAGMSSGGMQHFNDHWRAGSSGWWPKITAARVNAQMSAAFASALQPANEQLNIRIEWDCRYRDLNAVEYFWATVHPTPSEVWIKIVSPRAQRGMDPDTYPPLPNYGFNPTSDVAPGSIGPFTPLGDMEVANYDGTAGIDTSFDNDGGEIVRTEGFRESWSFFPLGEPVENGSQVLTGLSYTRDSWRPTGEEDMFEEQSLHSETGYLLWDAQNGHAYRVIALPRGVTLLAVATDVGAESTELKFEADAEANDPFRGGIVSNPILSGSVRTVRFASTMRIDVGGGAFDYEDIAEQVRDGEERVRHTDTNRVERI